jgi:hypothetical protein
MTRPDDDPSNEQAFLALDRAQSRNRELSAAGIKRKRLTPVERARLNPTSRKLAIAAKCYDCSGGGIDPGVVERIRDCNVSGCPLRPVRPYQRREASEGDESEVEGES